MTQYDGRATGPRRRIDGSVSQGSSGGFTLRTTRRRLPLLTADLVSLAALAFAALLITETVVIAHPWLASVITSIVIVIVPGHLVSRLLFPGTTVDLLQRIALSGAFGICILLVLGTIHLFLRVELTVMAWSFLAFNLLIVALSVFVRRISDSAPSVLKPRLRSKSAATISLRALFVLSFVILILFSVTTNSMWRYGDRWTYIPVIQQFLDAPNLGISDVYVGINPMGPRHQFAAWWVSQAFLSEISGIPPADLMSTYLSPLLMVISLLGVYSLTKELSRKTNLALLVVVVQILFYMSDIAGIDILQRGMIGFHFFGRLAEDKATVAFVLVPTAVFVATGFLARGRLEWAIAFFVLSAGIALNHPQGIFFLGLSCGLYMCVHLLFRRTRAILVRSMLLLLIILISMSVPLFQLIMRANRFGSVAAGAQQALDVFMELQIHRLYVISADKGLYMASPDLISAPLIILAIACAVVLSLRIRRDRTAQFIFSNLILVLVVLYNPLTASALGRIITPVLLWRVLWIAPIGLALGYAAYYGMAYLKTALAKLGEFLDTRTFRHSQTLSAFLGPVNLGYDALMPWVLVLILALSQLPRIQDGLALLERMKEATVTPQERAFLDHARSLIEAESYVLAPPMLSDLVPAFTNAYVLFFRDWQPYDPDARQDVQEFFRGRKVGEELVHILNKYDVVQYIIVPQDSHAALSAQFDRMPLVFTKLLQDQTFALFEVRPDRSTQMGRDIVWGSYHLLQGDHQEALQVFQWATSNESAARGSDLSSAYVGLGYAHLAQGQFSQAIGYLQKALTLGYNQEIAHIALGDAYSKNGDLQEAIDAYSHVLDSDLYANVALTRQSQVLGDQYQYDGQLDQALAAYERAARCDSSGVESEEETTIDSEHATILLAQGISTPGNQLELKTLVADGTRRVVLYEHPPSQADFALYVPASSHLKFSTVLSSEVWQLGKGDGVQFDIYVHDGVTKWHLFSEYIDPKNVQADRKWHEHQVALSPWAGQQITITLVTDPGPDGDDRYDWAGWGELRIVQPIAYDFLSELPNADFDGHGESQVRRSVFEIDCDSRPVLFQHPPSRISYRVSVPEQAALQFSLGLDPIVWAPDRGDGVEFKVYLRRPQEPHTLHQVFRRYVDPKNNPGDRHWLEQEVDLSAWGGQTVDIIFEALPGPSDDARFDWGGWGAPVLLGDFVAPSTAQ